MRSRLLVLILAAGLLVPATAAALHPLSTGRGKHLIRQRITNHWKTGYRKHTVEIRCERRGRQHIRCEVEWLDRNGVEWCGHGDAYKHHTNHVSVRLHVSRSSACDI